MVGINIQLVRLQKIKYIIELIVHKIQINVFMMAM